MLFSCKKQKNVRYKKGYPDIVCWLQKGVPRHCLLVTKRGTQTLFVGYKSGYPDTVGWLQKGVPRHNTATVLLPQQHHIITTTPLSYYHYTTTVLSPQHHHVITTTPLSYQFRSKWYLCARKSSHALHLVTQTFSPTLPLKQFQCSSD